MAKTDKQPAWNSADDAKLKALFDKPPSKGGIDTQDLGKNHIEKIRAKHWPARPYKNFSQLYRRKARQYNIDKTLRGSRKTAKKQKTDDDDEAEDEAEEAKEEEVEDAQDDNFVAPEDDDDLPYIEFSKMTVVASKPAVADGEFSMDYFFPYIMYHYEAKNRKVVTIDFLVLGMNKKFFRPKVTEDGLFLELAVSVPEFFPHGTRLEVADPNIVHNTHKLTAFRDVSEKIVKEHGTGDEEERIFGNPQTIKLPFEVETEIKKWDILCFEDDDEEHRETLSVDNPQQYFFVLSATLLSRKKRYKKKEGGMRVFQSPNDRRNDMEADQCNDSDDDY